MTHKELLESSEYWLAKIQIELFNEVEAYMLANGLNRVEFAGKLGVSKGYVSQILNGNADHRLSKIVELALSIGLAPTISFTKIVDETAKNDNSSSHFSTEVKRLNKRPLKRNAQKNIKKEVEL